MNGACNGNFCPAGCGPGEGSKGQISFNFNYRVNFKIFIPNFMPRGCLWFVIVVFSDHTHLLFLYVFS